MQLTDAEIREILIRRKIQKKRKMRRRRRMTILFLVILIAIIFILVRIFGSSEAEQAPAQSDNTGTETAATLNRGPVFIDPGHGGMDPGSDDDHDRYEKEDTLRLSLAVRDYLKTFGFKVEMSRTDDSTVDRTERGNMANKSGSKLFVSIHRNKADGDGQGVEGFIPQTDDEGSRFLGESIMHALGRAGFTERTIRAGTLNSSSDDYEENASTNMPSVLIEVGFLSSDYDNRLFDSNLNGNAKAIASAIDVTYMKLYEPEKYAEYERELTTASNIAKRSLKKIRKVMRITSKAASHEE